ncbi:MAG: carbohydrate ABC transporter permease [Clostridiales bacterium]|jgi:ABC-type glycerol-3-phosphate transport system permease component|nr:carbohydrate ABC transporter permease [Clostridiales bacterium]HOB36944.1 carbohydrate ABC transporter permease [Candidatus Avimonas sp.]HQD38345.1 carbohydrate ABC transporter permease [Candidatus Avimonas sp.]
MSVLSDRSRFARSTFGNILNFLVLLLVAAFMVIPMIYTISNAFKPFNELFIFPPRLLVMNPTFDNFLGINSILRQSWIPLTRYVLNSVVVTGVGVLGQIIFASLAGFVLSKEIFPGRDFLNKIVVFSLMFSGNVTAIPNYIIFTKLGIINTHLSLILPAFCNSLGLFLMKQFIDQMVPESLLEAARIDGAGEFRIYLNVVMPLCKPAWLTLLIFSFQSLWSTAGGTYIYDEQLRTLPSALTTMIYGGIARAGVSAAVALLLVIPPTLTFILSQSNVLQTMASSGMKE